MDEKVIWARKLCKEERTQGSGDFKSKHEEKKCGGNVSKCRGGPAICSKLKKEKKKLNKKKKQMNNRREMAYVIIERGSRQ